MIAVAIFRAQAGWMVEKWTRSWAPYKSLSGKQYNIIITLKQPLSQLWLKPVVTFQKRQQKFYIFQTWCTLVLQLSIFAVTVDLIRLVDHLVSINTCTAHLMSQYDHNWLPRKSFDNFFSLISPSTCKHNKS